MALFRPLLDAPIYLIGLVVLAYALKVYRQYHRLHNFKGPFGTGISNFWHSSAILRQESHLKYAEACEKYGPIARVGPNDLVTTSLDLLYLMNTARTQYTRAKWFYGSTRFEPGKDHIFSELDNKRHAKRRQQMAAGYSGKENPSLERSIDSRVVELIHLIRSRYISTSSSYKPMDLGRKIQFFTLDVISEIGFGQAFGDLKNDKDMFQFAESAELGLTIVGFTIATGIQKLFRWEWLARLAFPNEKDKAGFGKMLSTAKQLIHARFLPDALQQQDMVNSFMKHGMTESECVSEACFQISAGSDTTATAIRSTMLFLLSSPPCYLKLQAEIDSAIESHHTSSPVITSTKARQLPYLQAVIKEGLRIHPPVTDIFSKTVPPEGDTVEVDGKHVFLPGGTNVGYVAWGVHRDKNVFGEDADVFRPERWLDNSGKALESMMKTHDFTFGYGKWGCLGKNVALMELDKVFFELLRNFEFTIVNPEKPWKSVNNVGMFSQTELWVRVTERNARLGKVAGAA